MRTTLALALALSAAGCVYTTYDTGLPPSGVRHKDTATFFLWGLVGDKSLDLAQVCPQGVATWHDYIEFSDGLLSCLTCGIYGPRSIEIECAAAPAAAPPPPGPPPLVSWLLIPHPETHQTEVRPLTQGGRR